MEGKVPSGEPRILPAIGHRDDVARLEMLPIAVATAEAALGRLKLVALEPALDIIVEELLAPDHPGERLPQYAVVVWACLREQLVEEDIGLRPPLRKDDLAVGERNREGLRREHQVEPRRLADRDLADMPRGELGTGAVGVDRRRIAGDDAAMERVLHIASAVGHTP